MALLTFYKSTTEDGGAKGQQLTNGGVDDLYPAIDSQDRLNGKVIHRKIWYQTDASSVIMCTLSNQGQYNSCFFKTASGGNDVVGSITGNEDRFGALAIVSNGTDSVVVTNNKKWTLARVGDKAHIGNDVVGITAISDNGNGTSNITFSPAIPVAIHDGTFFATVIEENFTAGTAVPFWTEIDIPALSSISSNRDNHSFMSLY